MKRPNKTKSNQRITAATLADLSDYAPSTISAWTQEGWLKRGTDGLYDKLESLKAIAEHEDARANDGNTASNHGEIAKLRCELLKQRIIGAKHENAVLTGKVHDKEKCCLSLTQIFSAESRSLHNLGRCIVAQFPEAPKGTLAAIDKEVDEMLRRLKEGPAYKGQYFCPHCQKLIDEFFLEPIPEVQQAAPATVAEQPTKDTNV